MSLLKKLGFGKSSPTSEALDTSDLAAGLKPPAGAQGREKRAHIRFPLGIPAALYIDFGDGNLVPVKDVSYGGFVAEISEVPNQCRLPGGMQAKIFALSGYVTVTIGYVYSRGAATAFRFHHDTPDALLFLREPLESMRLGSTLTPISGDMLKAPYNQAGWMCLRGDGPTDLVMSADAKGLLTEVLMTYRQGEVYKEISLKGGIIKTSRSIDTAGYSASRMAQTDEVDPQSLKTALYILSGISDKATRKLSDQIIRMIVKLLPDQNGT